MQYLPPKFLDKNFIEMKAFILDRNLTLGAVWHCVTQM